MADETLQIYTFILAGSGKSVELCFNNEADALAHGARLAALNDEVNVIAGGRLIAVLNSQ